ncbi:hypothetical protein L7F22_067253 [Adiantum nelumboides]|nr:hypothetical protein [Adiantum nelumboides]
MDARDNLLGGSKDNKDEEEGAGAGSRRFDDLRSTLTTLTKEWQERAKGRRKSREAASGRKAEADDERAPWRKKLGWALESTAAHSCILALLLLDLLATVVDVLHTLHNDSHDLSRCVAMVEACHCSSSFDLSGSWEFLYWIGISVLCILSLNLIGLLLAFGLNFFRHAGYVLDLVVVVTALCLEIFLDTETAGLLVILNLWRIIRVAHGVLEVTDEAWEKKIHQLEARIQAVETAHHDDISTIHSLQLQVADLQGRVHSGSSRWGGSY